MAERQRRFDAYYYSFDPTGVDTIDGILSAVAWAGKCYHHTEEWGDDDPSEVQRIQAAANEAAAIHGAADREGYLRGLRAAFAAVRNNLEFTRGELDKASKSKAPEARDWRNDMRERLTQADYDADAIAVLIASAERGERDG